MRQAVMLSLTERARQNLSSLSACVSSNSFMMDSDFSPQIDDGASAMDAALSVKYKTGTEKMCKNNLSHLADIQSFK